ncbi:7558_t:CDS:10 [Ambispora gerdemannii]|uniref:7558_t:CDS:1 n=1 Tax=Ambispora gerdemannii TaxID=144530 RepID=A0A9N9B9P7_9GLOM|nr:7558_t:CDS:10 [Ambispora gerdemannii]
MRMVKNNSIAQCTVAGEPRMHLRLVFSNGTVRPLDFDFPVNKWNYCPTDRIHVCLVEPNLILLNYFNFSDVEPEKNGVYQENGVFVDYWGNIKNTFRLGFGSPYRYHRRITMGFSSSDGILRTYQLPNGDIGWNRFTKPDENAQISNDGEGLFYNKSINKNITTFRTFNLLEGGFGCIVVIRPIAQSPLELQDVSLPQWNAYVSFLKTGSSIPTKPFILYQTHMEFIKLEFTQCAIVYDGSGNECLMTTLMNHTVSMKTQNQIATNTNIISNDNNSTTTADLNQLFKTTLNIHFGSQGSVTDIQKLAADSQINDLYPLFYGGYVTIRVVNNATNETGGDMLDRDGIVREKWSFKTFTNHSCMFPLNNAIWAAKKDSKAARNWTILTKKFPRLKATNADDRYRNPNIGTTYPKIGAVIPSNIAQINITYDEHVILSSGNITIYQEGKSGSADIFRQGVNRLSKDCQITIKDKTVLIPVLDSTFNVQNATYYVIVDTNFVRASDTGEALLGMGQDSWRFTTEPFKAGGDDNGRKSGMIRLIPEATTEFKNLLKSSSSIYEDILNELANVLPISCKRLKIKKKYQIDSDQILLRITILPSENNFENSIKQIVSNLKTLIKHKEITSISRYNYTEWLDSSYGFQESIDLWEEYKVVFVVAITVNFLIAILFFMARRKNKQSQNIVIVTSALILQDVLFDFAFVIFNGKDVPKLFIPSLLTLIIPIAMNCTIALYVMLSENSRNDKFNSWFRKYPQVAAACTLFASGDVVILHVLTSQVAGLQIFSATFSEHAETVIFITSTLNLFIEDIPQFIIRILHWQNTVEYGIIPLIALWTSILVLLNAFIGRLYNGAIQCQKRRRLIAISTELEEEKTGI